MEITNVLLKTLGPLAGVVLCEIGLEFFLLWALIAHSEPITSHALRRRMEQVISLILFVGFAFVQTIAFEWNSTSAYIAASIINLTVVGLLVGALCVVERFVWKTCLRTRFEEETEGRYQTLHVNVDTEKGNFVCSIALTLAYILRIGYIGLSYTGLIRITN